MIKFSFVNKMPFSGIAFINFVKLPNPTIPETRADCWDKKPFFQWAGIDVEANPVGTSFALDQFISELAAGLMAFVTLHKLKLWGLD